MSTSTATHPVVDWPAFLRHATSRASQQLALVTLTLLLIPLAAIPLQISFTLPAPMQSNTMTGQAINGSLVAAWIVVESLALLALVKIKRWLDIHLRYIVWAGLVVLHLGVGIALAYTTGAVPWTYLLFPYAGTAAFTLLVVGYVLFHNEMEHRMLWWLVHNFMAMLLAIGLTVVLGSALPPVMVGAVLALLVVWDIVAVKYTSIMESLLDSTSNIFIPNYIILSRGWRVDYWALLEYINDDRRTPPPSVDSVLGLGDIIFPGGLVLAVATGGRPAVGIAVAVGVALAFMVMVGYQNALEREMLPALPWAALGAGAGYVLGATMLAPLAAVIGL